MSTEKMREEFEAAYTEGLVARCGEGFRSTAEYSLEQKRPDGEYLNYPDFIAWWAWQASRAAIEVELNAWGCDEGFDVVDESDIRHKLESLGLRVKP